MTRRKVWTTVPIFRTSPDSRLFFHDLYPASCLHVRQTGRFVWLKAAIVSDSPRPSVSKGFRAKKIFDCRGQFRVAWQSLLPSRRVTRSWNCFGFARTLRAIRAALETIWKHLEIKASFCYFSVTWTWLILKIYFWKKWWNISINNGDVCTEGERNYRIKLIALGFLSSLRNHKEFIAY